MSMYDKNHYNIVISLQLIKINGKKKYLWDTVKLNMTKQGMPVYTAQKYKLWLKQKWVSCIFYYSADLDNII